MVLTKDGVGNPKTATLVRLWHKFEDPYGTKKTAPTDLSPDSLMEVVKKLGRMSEKREDEKLENERDLTDIGTRMVYPKQISRSIPADTTPSLPDDWVGLNWWNLRTTTTSQNPTTPSSRDEANTFNNAVAFMLRPAVDLTITDTTVTPPIISVENETTEMEDSVIQDKHSYILRLHMRRVHRYLL